MEKYNVTGMSCAACQAHVEKAVNALDGVSSCSVSLLTNSMTVEGTASPDSIIKAVEDAGYGASVAGQKQTAADDAEMLKDHETPVLKRRLIRSVILLVILMYFSMGVCMWGFPAPSVLKENIVGIGIIEMLLAVIIMFINRKFFDSGVKSVIHGAPNMDTLVAMGSGVSFAYSFFILLKMTSIPDPDSLMNELYFESAAMIVTLITVGKLLEAISKGRTTDALKSLISLAPKTATVLRDGQEITVPVEDVSVGDTFVVRPGEQIPVDGFVTDGASAVDESMLTGESVPAEKEIGSGVYSGTINKSGFITCRASKVGQDTTLSGIIKLVSDSAATKAPIARIADKISGIFVPAVLIIAAITAVIWFAAGASTGTALTRAISVLVVSCPCALGLATPVAIMVGNGLAAKNGILFKTSESLEITGKSNIVVLDKTGTITSGVPRVTDILPADGTTQDELLSLAAGLEEKSEHPLGKAVLEYAKEKNISIPSCTDFEAIPGKGLKGKIDDDLITGGNLDFISATTSVPQEIKNHTLSFSEVGKTPLFFAKGDKLIGVIAVADEIRDESREAITELKNMGLEVIMLTGDNEKTASAIGDKAGVNRVISGVLPEGKDSIIKELRQYGRVIMVGDGINDAPALTSADTGIAIGAGTDVAIDAADIVLMKSNLKDVPAAVRISRKTVRNIHENLFWAFIYNILLIPLAAGLYSHLGVTMSPMLGAAAMSISSFTVCMNALRINLFDPYKTNRDKPCKERALIPGTLKSEQTKGDKNMTTKTMNIEGMMCEHCEMTVKKALEKIDGVSEAKVSHTEGTAIVSLESDVSDEVLTKAVTDKDYEVKSIS